MEQIKWIFDGIGTELFSLAIGVMGGGIVGYKIGVKRSGFQKQVAQDKAKQRQEFIIEKDIIDKSTININNNVKQLQKAGNSAEQIQIGGMKNGN